MGLKFMDNKKDDRYYIEKILNDIKLLQKYSEGRTVDDLSNDYEYTDAVMFRLVQDILSKELITLKDTLLEELCLLKQEEKKANPS